MAKHRILSAGHICIDLTPMIPDTARGKMPGELLVPGRLVRVDSASVVPGGSAYTVGMTMKQLGNDVMILGKVGKDALGGMIRETLAEAGVTGLIESGAVTTSYSFVLAIPEVDRCFLHHPGANDTFTADDIPEKALRGAELFHFGYPPLMRSMYENGGEELVRMLRRVKEHGIATSLDLAAVDPSSEAGKAPWEAILKKALPYVDFFMPSFEELLYMLDRPKYDALAARGGDMAEGLDPEKDALPLARKCLGMGCGCAVIKCGVSGMAYMAAGAERILAIGNGTWPEPALWADARGCQPCFPAEVKSAVGAGDVSIAAFLTAALEGRSPAECARLGAAEGAASVEVYDTQSGILPLDELERKFR